MSSQTTVRIDETTHRTLQALRRQTGETTPEILAKALEEYRRKHFLDGLAQDFRALQSDPKAWESEVEDRAVWDATSGDGLDE